MIRPCPYCDRDPERVRPVRVLEENEPMVGISEGPPDLSEAMTFDERDARIFLPCGHAFWREDLEAVLDELRQFRALRRELNRTEDPSRVEELKEYEIPAQVNAVNNRKRECERAERAEEAWDDD